MQNRPQRRSQPSAGFSRNVRNRIPCRCVLPISEPPVEVFIDHQKGTVFTPERIFRLYCALRTHPSADHSQVTFARLRSHSLAHPGSSLSPRLRSAPFANSSRRPPKPGIAEANRASRVRVPETAFTQLHFITNRACSRLSCLLALKCTPLSADQVYPPSKCTPLPGGKCTPLFSPECTRGHLRSIRYCIQYRE